MCDTPQFRCQFSDCCYQSYAFNRMLQHTWDKHSLAPGFKFRCNISDCPRTYKNLQSFRRHLKAVHKWFYQIHYNVPEKSDNINTSNLTVIDDEAVKMNVDDISDVENNEINYDNVVASFLLELRHKYGITTDCTCFVSDQMRENLRLDRKHLAKQLTDSLAEIMMVLVLIMNQSKFF